MWRRSEKLARILYFLFIEQRLDSGSSQSNPYSENSYFLFVIIYANWLQSPSPIPINTPSQFKNKNYHYTKAILHLFFIPSLHYVPNNTELSIHRDRVTAHVQYPSPFPHAQTRLSVRDRAEILPRCSSVTVGCYVSNVSNDWSLRFHMLSVLHTVVVSMQGGLCNA